MAETKPIMPGDLPEWIQEAERAMANGEIPEPKEVKEVTIKFGKGLVGKPFTSKSGHDSQALTFSGKTALSSM